MAATTTSAVSAMPARASARKGSARKPAARRSGGRKPAVRKARTVRISESALRRLFERSIRDPLTGLYNRFYMADHVQRLARLQDRGQSGPVGLVIFDVDDFKSINRRGGYAAGDRVLAAVAGAIHTMCRRSDVPVRLGGDEFAVFAVAERITQLRAVARRVSANVAVLVSDKSLGGTRVTISGGAALRRKGESLAALLARADKALVRSRRAARRG